MNITATPNFSKRTFTLRRYYINIFSYAKVYAKFRTEKMSVYEFNECLHNTQNDWANYLKTNSSYYKI